MINTVSAGKGIHVSGGYSIQPYINMCISSAGLVRHNGSSFEVYNGSSWIILDNALAHISLEDDVYEIIEWARQKRAEEAELYKLMAEHPIVKEIKERLDVTVALVRDHGEIK